MRLPRRSARRQSSGSRRRVSWRSSLQATAHFTPAGRGAYKARMRAKWQLLIVFAGAAATVQGQGAAGQETLDFLTYRAKIEPIFLARRADHARCYACHSQGTPLRLQELSP